MRLRARPTRTQTTAARPQHGMLRLGRPILTLTVARLLRGMHRQEHQTRIQAAEVGVVLPQGELKPGEVLPLEGQRGVVVTVMLGTVGYGTFTYSL